MPNINQLCYILGLFAFALSITDIYGFENLQMLSFFSKLTSIKDPNVPWVLDSCSPILILLLHKINIIINLMFR